LYKDSSLEWLVRHFGLFVLWDLMLENAMPQTSQTTGIFLVFGFVFWLSSTFKPKNLSRQYGFLA